MTCGRVIWWHEPHLWKYGLERFIVGSILNLQHWNLITLQSLWSIEWINSKGNENVWPNITTGAYPNTHGKYVMKVWLQAWIQMKGNKICNHRYQRDDCQTRGGVELLESPEIMAQYHTFTHGRFLPLILHLCLEPDADSGCHWEGLIWYDRPITTEIQFKLGKGWIITD